MLNVFLLRHSVVFVAMPPRSYKRSRLTSADEGSKRAEEGVTIASYVEMLLRSLGYDAVGDATKRQFEQAVERWICAMTDLFRKEGHEYTYVHVILFYSV